MLDRRGQLCRFQLRGKLADEMVESICRKEHQSSSLLLKHIPSATNPTSNLDADSDHEDGFQASLVAEQCGSTNVALLRERLAPASERRSKKLSTPVPERIYSIMVPDPRVARAPPLRTGLADLSLLREPAQSELARAEEIRCPVSREPLTLQGKDADEPDSALILKKLSEILSWTNTPSADAGPLATSYPFVSPLEELQSSKATEDESAMRVDEDSASLVPCSFLWSKAKRHVLSSAFRKDHEINDKRFRDRQRRSLTSGELACENAVAASAMLHMLVIDKLGPFKSTSGWDLVLTPTFAPVVLKALVFAGALVVGLDENDALSTVLEQPWYVQAWMCAMADPGDVCG